MSQAPLTLILNTTEDRAVLLLEVLISQARETPSLLPSRADWLDLAEQVAIGLATFQAGIVPRVKVDDRCFTAERA